MILARLELQKMMMINIKKKIKMIIKYLKLLDIK